MKNHLVRDFGGNVSVQLGRAAGSRFLPPLPRALLRRLSEEALARAPHILKRVDPRPRLGRMAHPAPHPFTFRPGLPSWGKVVEAARRASSLSDFGSSIEYGFVAGGFGVGLRWGWFLPEVGLVSSR